MQRSRLSGGLGGGRYLFALVAGDLGSIKDSFTTKSGRKVPQPRALAPPPPPPPPRLLAPMRFFAPTVLTVQSRICRNRTVGSLTGSHEVRAYMCVLSVGRGRTRSYAQAALEILSEREAL